MYQIKKMYQNLVESAIRDFMKESRYHEGPSILVMRPETYYELLQELIGKNMYGFYGDGITDIDNPRYKNQKIVRTTDHVGLKQVIAY